VEYSRWAPLYRQIAAEFGFPFESEEAAAAELRALLPPEAFEAPIDRLGARIRDREVIVVGLAPGAGSPPLEKLGHAEATRAIVAADGAASICLSAGIVPEVIVTDLDGPVPAEVSANARGAFVVVHAHGDNRPALAEWVPQFPGPITGSWAGPPTEELVNFGGFTDGDRAVFLAEALGARRILLFGFDFEEVSQPDPGGRKLRKLAWARRVIDLLARESSVPIAWLRGDGSQRPVHVFEGVEEPTGPSIQ
jgi:uncharacterized Rossmann fold enzyme